MANPSADILFANDNADGKPTVFVISPLPSLSKGKDKKDNSIGGVTVSSWRLLRDLSRWHRADLNWKAVNLADYRKHAPFGIILLFSKLVASLRHVQVVYAYTSLRTFVWLGPVLMVAKYFFRKKVFIRTAGTLEIHKQIFWGRSLCRWSLPRADRYAAQTQKLVSTYRSYGWKNVLWFPTNRADNRYSPDSPRQRSCRKLVYAAQLRTRKGTVELIEAMRQINLKGVQLDLYGPLWSDLPDQFLEDLPDNVAYCGLLDLDQLEKKLPQYDLMILPTKAKSEGYPGSIIDGYQAGLPVISCSVGGIPEIVSPETGILVEAGNITQLKEAIEKTALDDQYYHSLLEGVFRERKKYSSTTWCQKFVDTIYELAGMADR
ncbi:MAG: glycosyltransferase family 4 protein [Pirellulaceae bacterium]|nr:glycosyltransferase family 4 protein [Pirellulaceae bacterium]